MKTLLFLTLTLAACGKQKCESREELTEVLNVGLYEEIVCPGGYVKTVTPKRLPGGIITHLEVQCAKAVVTCQ